MKRIIIITIISCAAWISKTMAQSADDVILFSRYFSGGTARSAGMSGAFGALGGDMSVISSNPAGLAVYRSSEFTITPAMNFAGTNADIVDHKFNENSARFMMNNLGYVYTKNLYNEKGLQSFNFGIAYNRLNDFNSKAYIRRAAATSSMLDEFVYYANGYDKFIPIPMNPNDLNTFYEGLAYDMYAIDIDSNGEYFSDYDDYAPPYGPLYRSMSSRLNVGEYALSLGLNFNHNLYFGATLGIQDVSYRDYYFHEEKPDFEYMRDFNFSDEYTINGVGLNFKTGVIWRPIQMLRFGAAVHTPTHLWLKPYLLTGMGVNWNNTPPTEDGKAPNAYLETESDPSERYRITTPWRYNLSAAAVLGNRGIVNVDVEVIDYSSSSVMPKSKKENYDSDIIEFYDDINNDISSDLKTAVNVKGGGEVRLGPVYLRGGMAFYGNPYNTKAFDDDIKKTLKNTMSYSAGIGFRNRDFYMDAAYIYMKHPKKITNLYLSYNDDSAWYEQATLQTTSSKVVLTFGFRF